MERDFLAFQSDEHERAGLSGSRAGLRIQYVNIGVAYNLPKFVKITTVARVITDAVKNAEHGKSRTSFYREERRASSFERSACVVLLILPKSFRNIHHIHLSASMHHLWQVHNSLLIFCPLFLCFANPRPFKLLMRKQLR